MIINVFLFRVGFSRLAQTKIHFRHCFQSNFYCCLLSGSFDMRSSSSNKNIVPEFMQTRMLNFALLVVFVEQF